MTRFRHPALIERLADDLEVPGRLARVALTEREQPERLTDPAGMRAQVRRHRMGEHRVSVLASELAETEMGLDARLQGERTHLSEDAAFGIDERLLPLLRPHLAPAPPPPPEPHLGGHR